MNATLGTDMEYIFSHSTMAGSTGYYEDPWAANQVSQQRPADVKAYSMYCCLFKLDLLSYCSAGKVGYRYAVLA